MYDNGYLIDDIFYRLEKERCVQDNIYFDIFGDGNNEGVPVSNIHFDMAFGNT